MIEDTKDVLGMGENCYKTNELEQKRYLKLYQLSWGKIYHTGKVWVTVNVYSISTVAYPNHGCT